MKKLILGLLATTIVASPLAITPASAAPQRNQRDHRYDNDRGRGGPAANNYRRWSKGQRFDRRYAQNYREIPNWQQYRGRRLYAPPRGYHWVRSGNDAVLVAVAGGLIGAVLAGAFN